MSTLKMYFTIRECYVYYVRSENDVKSVTSVCLLSSFFYAGSQNNVMPIALSTNTQKVLVCTTHSCIGFCVDVHCNTFMLNVVSTPSMTHIITKELQPYSVG